MHAANAPIRAHEGSRTAETMVASVNELDLGLLMLTPYQVSDANQQKLKIIARVSTREEYPQ